MLRGSIPTRLGSTFVLALTFALAAIAHAGGPRFITGTNYVSIGPGNVMAFYTPQLSYFTDPGDLASNVPHAQADALVASAAAVWNVPYTSLVLSQGGTLAEHVSSGNAYFNGTQMVFPADVSASNYATIPIAIVYDTDGSVTDQLLGTGASDPLSCRLNGVTSSVDSFSPSGQILHAVVILNGRCVGSAPQQLTQIEYQLMRAFGRVLGLAWSQLNDNVFTGSPSPTTANVTNWPVMHPIDVLCGPYTYQCMQNPFQLRNDDISSLALLYPQGSSNASTGKIATLDNASAISGSVLFPTQAGMEMVNVTLTRLPPGGAPVDPAPSASAVAGATFLANGGNRVTGAPSSAQNAGVSNAQVEGDFWVAREPVVTLEAIFLTTEPINPLYWGSYALGAFQRPVLAPSGTATSVLRAYEFPGQGYNFPFEQQDAAATCSPIGDGTESAPAASDPSGLWTGLLCGIGHQSWFSVTVRPGRTWTLETTALDNSGNATLNKAQPVLGVWNASDPVNGSAPTVASAPFAMNALAAGVTQVQMASATTSSSYRFVVADQFGGGRPDFSYRARVLYADAIAPATAGAGGVAITLTGTGFLPGNRVLVNGVVATVTSVSSTQIQAIAPSMAAAGAVAGTPVDVEVYDAGTGGSSTITSALTYSTAADLIQTVTAPSALYTGIPSAPFVAQVLTSDGVTPAAGATVTFAITQGAALLGCGAASCTLTTDAAGHASTTILPTAAGTITVTATEQSGGNSVTLTLSAANPTLSVTIAQPTAYVAAGATSTWTLTASALLDGAPSAGTAVSWSTSAGSLNTATSTTGAQGTASAAWTLATPAPGTYTLTACAWTTICSAWNAIAVDSSRWTPTITAGAGQSIPQAQSLAPITVQVTDGAGHALPGATVTIRQQVEAWEGPCPTTGPCPAAPVLATSSATLTADASGNVQVTPLTVPGQPQVVNIAVITGSQGFASLSLVKTP